MNLLSLYLLDVTLILPLVGAVVVAFIKAPADAFRCCFGFVVVTFVCGCGASLEYLSVPNDVIRNDDIFAIDNLTAPMIPMLAMLHLLTLMGTAKSHVTISFCMRLLLAEFINLSIVSSHSRSIIVGLLLFSIVLPAWDLFSRGMRLRGYLLYMTAFALLLIAGWRMSENSTSVFAVGLLLIALLIRGGILPLHGWQPPLFQRASLGTSMLYVLSLVEVLAVIRLVLPHASVGMLQVGGAACLATAVYCGALAVVQNNVRRFYAHLCLSQTSLVLFAIMAATPSSLTAALCLWMSTIVSLGGLGFAIRSLEARFGELSLSNYHGHYNQVPGLAICFFTTGLAAVGFPGTIGFIPMELLISSSMTQGLAISLALALAAMLNALAIMRAYFALFTGRKPTTSVSLQVSPIERAGIVIITLLVFLGGWFSPSVVESRHRVAEELLQHHLNGREVRDADVGLMQAAEIDRRTQVLRRWRQPAPRPPFRRDLNELVSPQELLEGLLIL